MDNQGTLTIDALQQDTSVVVKIHRYASGIPHRRFRQKNFEPFLRDKPAGEGMG
jgi:C4-dicarboxylate-specific signal transduction histidine kinase